MLRHQSLKCAVASLIILRRLVVGGGGGGGGIQLISATSNKKRAASLIKICSLRSSMNKSELGLHLLAGSDVVHGKKRQKMAPTHCPCHDHLCLLLPRGPIPLVPQACPGHDPAQEISSACWESQVSPHRLPGLGTDSVDKGDPALSLRTLQPSGERATSTPSSTTSSEPGCQSTGLGHTLLHLTSL